jgi:hypothetical protein
VHQAVIAVVEHTVDLIELGLASSTHHVHERDHREPAC